MLRPAKRYFPRILNLHFRNRDQAEGLVSLSFGYGFRPLEFSIAATSDGHEEPNASLGQSPHGVPGWQDNGLLLHHGQDLLGHVLLVHHHLVHVLGEPVVRHDQVTWGGKNSITAQRHCRKGATDNPPPGMMH